MTDTENKVRIHRLCNCRASFGGSYPAKACNCDRSLVDAPTLKDKPEAGQWTTWDEGECPVHEKSEVDVVWHNTEHGTVGTFSRKAGAVNWQYVIRYRVIKEYREPREFWVFAGRAYSSEVRAIEVAILEGFKASDVIHVREVMEDH